jgi:hypothetical protein
MTFSETWDNLTKYDKNIIFFLICLIFFFVVYSVICGVWAKSISGLAFSLSIIALMSVFTYYKSAKSGEPAEIK